MSQYSHLLIPLDHDYCPSVEPLAEFLGQVVTLGVVGDAPTIEARTIKRVPVQTRELRNQVTGETLVVQMPTRWPDRRSVISSIAELADAVAGAKEFDVDVSDTVLPKVAPLVIDFSEPYHLLIGHRIRSQLVSMSDLHDEVETDKNAVFFGRDCGEADSLGLYTHPESLELIELPDAGCARFWIEFELGKFLYPRIDDKNLRILNPQLVGLAERCFQTDFAQGCHWCA